MVDLRNERVGDLREHAGISSAFSAHSVYEVRPTRGRIELIERSLAAPFHKDYDALEHPLTWSSALGSTESMLISAFAGTERVGGIIVAKVVPGLLAWTEPPGVTVLWDLRVHPDHRRQSIGTSLLHAAQTWASRQGCTEIVVETQNTNVAACNFYMRNGFALREGRHGAYLRLPDDVQLLWRKELDG